MLVNPKNPYSIVFIFPIQNELRKGRTVYEATRRAWSVAERFRDADSSIAVGLDGGICKGVFTIKNWHIDPKIIKKYEFNGVPLNDLSILYQDFANVISNVKGYWGFGNYLIVEFDGKGHVRYIRGNPDHKTVFVL